MRNCSICKTGEDLRYLRILLLFLLYSIATNSTSAQPEAEKTKIRGEIHEVLLKQQQDWNEGSVEKYIDGYDKSDSVRFASGGSVSYGWKTMLERYKKGYPDRTSMGVLEFSGVDINPLSASSAMAFGKWKLKRDKDEPWGYFTLLFRNTAAGWKIVHDHTSSARK